MICFILVILALSIFGGIYIIVDTNKTIKDWESQIDTFDKKKKKRKKKGIQT